ncbi:hypothetical protein ABT009_10120 [Streptomyces sp. NPDC002896]|uniref:hypothetical protein n=1 Tax=Streptomyces sp. NPDC002896 TaxID=3154438 RepID=UPI00331DEC27
MYVVVVSFSRTHQPYVPLCYTDLATTSARTVPISASSASSAGKSPSATILSPSRCRRPPPARLFPLPTRSEYVAAPTRRAHATPPQTPAEASSRKLAGAPGQRLFAASINDFEAVLECCAKYSLDVVTVHKQELPDRTLVGIASLITERHAEHGILQPQVFSGIFEWHIPSRFDFERAA